MVVLNNTWRVCFPTIQLKSATFHIDARALISIDGQHAEIYLHIRAVDIQAIGSITDPAESISRDEDALTRVRTQEQRGQI